MALNSEQLRAYIRELDTEYRRNRLAAETLLRSLEKNDGVGPVSSSSIDANGNKTARKFEGNISAEVEKIVAANPEDVWEVRTVIERFKRNGIPLQSTDPTKTVSNALAKLLKVGKLEVIQKGSGSIPNKYRWKLGAVIGRNIANLATFWDKPQ